jgi:hypothetical protein
MQGVMLIFTVFSFFQFRRMPLPKWHKTFEISRIYTFQSNLNIGKYLIMSNASKGTSHSTLAHLPSESARKGLESMTQALMTHEHRTLEGGDANCQGCENHVRQGRYNMKSYSHITQKDGQLHIRAIRYQNRNSDKMASWSEFAKFFMETWASYMYSKIENS